MNNKISILMPTSPVPSHPSLSIVEDCIGKIRNYTDGKIIFLIDGIYSSLAHRTESYDKYKSDLITNIDSGKYGDASYIDFTHHRHQSNMVKLALKEIVTTPLFMFVEHDCAPIGDIPFDEICDIVLNNQNINYVRFNIFTEVLPEHEYLFLENIEINGIKMRHTLQYSARPSIMKVSWMRDILFNYFKEGEKVMLEDKFIGIPTSKYKELGYDTFGMYLYTPDGNMLRSYHADSRGNDEKVIYG